MKYGNKFRLLQVNVLVNNTALNLVELIENNWTR